jgi:hypothetical protein
LPIKESRRANSLYRDQFFRSPGIIMKKIPARLEELAGIPRRSAPDWRKVYASKQARRRFSANLEHAFAAERTANAAIAK